jgi:hypothetical protein
MNSSARLCVAAAVIMVVVGARGATDDPLFPSALHFTRVVHDPLTKKVVTVEEYCHGDRMISIAGPRTSVVDYRKGELLEIDRSAGTYSITPFAAIARARSAASPRAAEKSASKATDTRWNVRSEGASDHAGRRVEKLTATRSAAKGSEEITVSVDRSVHVSRAAAEVLLGAAYPNPPDERDETILGAIRNQDGNARSADETYPLIVEKTFRLRAEGEAIEFGDEVTRIGSEDAPSDLIAIPAGARQVESKIVVLQRELSQADSLPSSNHQK